MNSCGTPGFPISRQVGLRNEALCQIVVTRFRPLDAVERTENSIRWFSNMAGEWLRHRIYCSYMLI